MTRIGILNYADVRNFGDVLFPLIVAHEVRTRIPMAEISYITATGSTWAGMESTRLDDTDLEGFDALLLGGGEIVHRFDDMLSDIYSRFGLTGIARPTDLVYSWTRADVPYKAWLGLGIPEPSAEVQGDIGYASATLHIAGVRGSQSHRRLLACGINDNLTRLTPDLGWFFPRLLAGRRPPKHPAEGQPYIAVQALGFTDPGPVAATLRRIADASGLRIVLLPLTRCWHDAEPLRLLQAAGGEDFILVDDAMEDLDKLTILGGATLYAGQSMHGFIGAMSQNRPAGLITPYADDKFNELLTDLDLHQFRCPGWDGLNALVSTLMWAPPVVFAQQRKKAERELGALFDEVCTGILTQSQSLRPSLALMHEDDEEKKDSCPL